MKKIKGRERICLDRDCNMAWTRIQWMGDPEWTTDWPTDWVEVKRSSGPTCWLLRAREMW
jgi:hypothetical protein